jgi:hypothetical protein
VASSDDDTALDRFLSGQQSNDDFRHRDHVRVAYALLGRYPFAEAAHLFARELRAIATRAGRPGAYHETITLAFLSLIAEHSNARRFETFDDFAHANPELLEKATLLRWYTPERLESEAARRTFLLPPPSLRGR